MHTIAPMRNRRAFSLLELLLVIFIVSLVYFLGFQGVEKQSKNEPTLSLQTVVEDIRSLHPEGGTLICTSKCKRCYFKSLADADYAAYSGAVRLPELTVFTIDKSENLQQLEYGRFNDEKICLMLDFAPNGSVTQAIIRTEEKAREIYFLPSYFGRIRKANSLDEAQSLWLAHNHDIDSQGDFY